MEIDTSRLSPEQLERYTLLLVLLGLVIVLLGGVLVMILLPRVFRFLRPGESRGSKRRKEQTDPWTEAGRRIRDDSGEEASDAKDGDH